MEQARKNAKAKATPKTPGGKGEADEHLVRKDLPTFDKSSGYWLFRPMLAGQKPDEKYCRASVPSGGWGRSQCSRKPTLYCYLAGEKGVHGFCTQHYPGNVRRRRDELLAARERENARRVAEWEEQKQRELKEERERNLYHYFRHVLLAISQPETPREDGLNDQKIASLALGVGYGYLRHGEHKAIVEQSNDSAEGGADERSQD